MTTEPGAFEFRDYQCFTFERRNRVLTATINRPEAMNAVNARLHEEFSRLFTDLAAFPQVAAYYARLSQRPAFRAALPAPDAAHRIYTRERYFEPS